MALPKKPLSTMTLNLPCPAIDYFMRVLQTTPLVHLEVAPVLAVIMAEIDRNNAEAAAKEQSGENA